VDQEDQGDHNPPWWTRTGFYILLMEDSFDVEEKSGDSESGCLEGPDFMCQGEAGV